MGIPDWLAFCCFEVGTLVQSIDKTFEWILLFLGGEEPLVVF